ncbi:hypothetical protein ACFYNM_18590 [Streptomyces spororaveus]|uniref:hypothetical protein n=1 Tax=Streptomyces spororaveus TaxID=284039 RepID=UPI0036D16DF9
MTDAFWQNVEHEKVAAARMALKRAHEPGAAQPPRPGVIRAFPPDPARPEVVERQPHALLVEVRTPISGGPRL